MLLATSEIIRKIDNYAEVSLGIPTSELIARAGKAVADVIRTYVSPGARIVVLAGKGNNGADGYAAAIDLHNEYNVEVFDVFGVGQTSDGGKATLAKYTGIFSAPHSLPIGDELYRLLSEADCVVDAIFGVGFKGTVPTVTDAS